MAEAETTERTLLTKGLPDEAFPVPGEGAFKRTGEGVMAAAELALIGQALIELKGLGLEHLAKYRVGYLWSRTGGTRGGKPNLGSAALADRKLKHYGDVDVVVLLAADHARDLTLTRWQVEALVCHLLCHISISITEKTGEERLVVVGHDAELFRAEVKRYGPWSLDLRLAATTLLDVRQMGFAWADGDVVADGDDEDVDGLPVEFGPGSGEVSADPESEIPGTVETFETDERVEQWIRGGQNGATETASGEMSAREYNLYLRHQTGIRTDDLAGTPRSTEKLLDRARDLEQRLSSPAVRKRNVEDYRAELRAIREEVTRRSAGTVVWDGSAPPDDFDAGGDELARKQGIVATLQAAGMEIDLVDGDYVEPATGVQIEEAYAEAEFQKALGDLTPATAAAG